ncbi:MAG: hypothetical protein M3P06_14580 [Acidobacteriota bacterium]|nr:hypothetical protein [Acidobacteriota bacterium]
MLEVRSLLGGAFLVCANAFAALDAAELAPNLNLGNRESFVDIERPTTQEAARGLRHVLVSWFSPRRITAQHSPAWTRTPNTTALGTLAARVHVRWSAELGVAFRISQKHYVEAHTCNIRSKAGSVKLSSFPFDSSTIQLDSAGFMVPWS